MADVPILVELIREFYEESSHQIDASVAVSAFSILLENPRYGAVWILESGGVPAGYVVLTVCFSMESAGMTGFVDDLFVRPRHRRKGLGREALNTVFDECRRRGIGSLQVVVDSTSTEASKLYGSVGFRSPEDHRQTLVASVDASSST